MSEHENLEQTNRPASDRADKAKKEKKPEKKSKPGFFSRIAKWLRDMRSELKKVQWPTRKQTANNTLIVIVCVAVIGVFIWIFDFIAVGAIQGLISLLS